MFKLKRPCASCPFKRGMGESFRLHPDRIDEIVNATAFQCHKTVDYSDDRPAPGDKPQQCAGLMALLIQEGRPNQIMQIAARFGELDFDSIETDEVYSSIDEAVAAHCGN